MKRLKRIIEVFEGKFCRVEVEGNTISVQIVDANTKQVGVKFAVPVPVACDVCAILSSALALPGDIVNETSLETVSSPLG